MRWTPSQQSFVVDREALDSTSTASVARSSRSRLDRWVSSLLLVPFLSALCGSLFSCAGQAETCSECTLDGGDADGGAGASGDGDISAEGNEKFGRCTNPDSGRGSSGFVRCDEGYSHRPESLACPNVLPRDEFVEWPPSDLAMGGAAGTPIEPYTTSTDECSSDRECGADEFCTVVQTNLVHRPGCAPEQPIDEAPDYGRICEALEPVCVTDDDCAADQACVCGMYRGFCTDISGIGMCRTDADCAGEALCLNGYRCQQPEDECNVNADCRVDHECSIESGLKACTPFSGHSGC